MSHSGPGGNSVGDRVREQGYSWRMVGENIAAGQRSANSVFDSWVRSRGHYANILKDAYTDVGFGAARADARYGSTIYWCTVFARGSGIMALMYPKSEDCPGGIEEKEGIS